MAFLFYTTFHARAIIKNNLNFFGNVWVSFLSNCAVYLFKDKNKKCSMYEDARCKKSNIVEA